MTKKSTPPDYLVFSCPLTIEAGGPAELEGASDKPTPRFNMVAYTGGTMRIQGFPHPVVVDLEGLSIDRQDIPVRLDHNPRQGVGHTRRVAIENGQVLAEGLISRDTSWARDVARSGVKGFPWQASIGASIIDAQFVPGGQTVTVNGRTFTGPLHVVRQAVLKEISFVDSGADANTSARVAAQHKEIDSMEDTQTRTPDTDTPDAPVDIPQTDNPPVPEAALEPAAPAPAAAKVGARPGLPADAGPLDTGPLDAERLGSRRR